MYPVRPQALLVLLLTLLPVRPGAALPGPELRLLIDVSGSMQQTDPEGLRGPALQLLTGLLPPDGSAGIWIFAERPEQLLAPAPADAAFKAAAGKAAQRIHARGQRTDIEAALRAAAADWLGAPGTDAGVRHLVLLTDGMVDVGTDPAPNERSRERIVQQLLPALREAGVRLHAVALSNQADHALLGALAAQTEGWYERAEDASALLRIFLRLFEQTAAGPSLPMDGNRFEVDASIREMTVLAFRGAAAPGAELSDPDGRRFSAASHPAALAWRAAEAYDLITVQRPAPGTWQLHADQDPDNRVLIVTDLDLAIDPLPPRLLAGEHFALQAWLTEQGRPIERPDFLRLLEGQVELGDEHGVPVRAALSPLPGTARLSAGIVAPEAAGQYRLRIRIDGGTFTRELVRAVQVPGTAVRLQLAGDGAQRVVIAELDGALIDPGSVTALLEITAPDGGQRAQPPDPPGAAPDPARLQFTLGQVEPGRWSYRLHGQARTASGRSVSLAAPALTVGEGAGQAPATPAPRLELQPLRAAALVAGANLLFALASGALWLVLRVPAAAPALPGASGGTA